MAFPTPEAGDGAPEPRGPVPWSSPRPSLLERLLELFLRLAAIGLTTWILSRLPLPILEDWLPVKNVVIAVIGVALTGKTLYDTLFYDHFRP